ncbi:MULTISPECIES: maleylpyruvate isomerase N-terminal domain-containing protein [unclassified Streptomyces]|uniref:maleylpyruvate isomerase N-terminal domain-containing protein n=1 Tax=unclassified Streptomyces TaxID=2593676 RepID=UPI002E13F925|nr:MULTISPECIES: maleylpyruvate isomerase N-terminal domain-containing protein [unclassified Streptomyces]WSJ23792.1 maleylpyruvate isomerase family mycothiol-dependent enzyme [Streptomyces sp. NBC_01324]
MEKTLEFSDLLRLIDERSTAFRAAVAAAPDLDAQVPTCPEWTLFDLVQHLGEGRRSWAATVAAGPDAVAKAECEDAPPAPRDRRAMLDWLAASTQELLDALREAGPDRGCWTWWGASQSPRTCGAVARHQLQQIAVHTYDAQLTAGAPQPLPDEVALDGVEEFLFTCNATPSPWPHKPTTIDYHATEGRSWRLTVDGDGARSTRIPAPTAGEALEAAGLSVSGKAGELVLALYDRIGPESLEVSGDREIFDQLIAWEPEE